jgi:hypothetical protein
MSVYSTEISDETLTVVKTDDGINVNTPFGLSLEFDIVHDNCLVTIDGPYRNETIGECVLFNAKMR